jgi:DNA-binding SARP family transcriptional activator/tetratricopeptide (TPR) repeat protein
VGSGVEFRLLGPFHVLRDGQPVGPAGPKRRGLLAMLVLRANHTVPVEDLIGGLWADDPPPSAANLVQTYVSAWRKTLEPGRAARGGGDRLVTVGPGYRLRTEPGELDLDHFTQAVASAEAAAGAGDHADAADRLAEALGLWRGPTLADLAWLPFHRAAAGRLGELRLQAVEAWALAALRSGNARDVLPAVQEARDREPLRERLCELVMWALFQDGRQGEALAAYEQTRRVLADELGADPGPGLRDMHAQVLRHDPALRPAAAPVKGTPRAYAEATRQSGPETGRDTPERSTAAAVPPYFGRAAEMSRLLGCFDEAAAGRGGVVLLAGEPGIGKSHALQLLTEAARARRATVLAGRCLEGAWVPPFRPFAEAIATYGESVDPGQLKADLGPAGFALVRIAPQLAQLLPDLTPPPPLQPDEERFRLIDAVVQFFTALAARATVLLVLEDLHWADAGIAMMMRHVARACGRRRLLIAGAYRTTEKLDQDPLVEILGAMRAEAECTAIRLGGLGTKAVGQLLAADADAPVSPALITAMAAHTAGNPFFTKEMIRHLAEERLLHRDSAGELETSLPLVAVPEGVRQVLARRRAHLSPGANGLLEVASGFAGPFLFPVAATVAELDDTSALSALDELLAAGMIRPDEIPERYEFGHALVRQAVYDTLNPSRQARLHRRLARELETARARVPACTDPAEIVSHYASSRALPGAAAGVAAAVEAADLAQAAGAHEAAGGFLTTAADLAGLDDERLTTICGRLGLALAWALRFDDAVTVARDAAERIARDDGPQAAADYLAEVTTALSAAGSTAHAWELAPVGLKYAGSSRGEAWAALTLLALDRKEAADPDYAGIPRDQPRRREALAILYRSSRVVLRSVDLARYAVAAIYERRDNVPAEAAQDPTVGLYLLGSLRPVLSVFERAAAEARSRGELAREVHCRASIARALAALGDLADSRAALEQARELVARIPRRGWSWERIKVEGAGDALTLATGEDWESQEAVYAEIIGSDDPEPRWNRAPILAGRARTAAYLGQHERAMALLPFPVKALGQAPAWALNYPRVASDTAQTLWLLNRRDHLQAVETAVRRKALPADFRFPMMDMRLSLARLCAVDGRLEEADHWFGQARSVLEEQGARPLRAIVDFDQALMNTRAGHMACARRHLDAAISQFQQIGMTGWLRQAEQLDALLS